MSEQKDSWSAVVPTTIGATAIIVMLGALGVWSVKTQIAGAVVASGVIEVESERQVIQHPDGGVVGAIFARDGDLVAAGDVLVRLDDTFLKNELAIVEGQLLEIFARMARFEAERDDTESVTFNTPPELMYVPDDKITEQLEGQKRLFEARRISLAQNAQQIAEQKTQVAQQIQGIEAQRAALDRQLKLIKQELADVQNLFDQGLMKASRLLELQRAQAKLEGEIGSLTARVAEARTQISGLEIQRLTLFDQRREEAISRLRDLGYNELELVEKRLGLIERLSRLDVRAPVAGITFGSSVFAEQSVVRAADPMMYIVPGDQPLQVSARISPTDIEQVYTGQEVSLMFTTFNRRTTPEVAGKVVRVAADAARDEATGEAFYEAILMPDAAALEALENVSLLPGMPAEAFLKTENRTPLSYLTQPLIVYFQRAFRED